MRRTLYRTASLLGDLQALLRGPLSLLRRLARKAIYGRSMRVAGWVTRRLGVGR